MTQENEILLPKKEKIPTWVIYILYGLTLMTSLVLAWCSSLFGLNLVYPVCFIGLTLAINYVLIERMISNFNTISLASMFVLTNLRNRIADLEEISNIANGEKTDAR